MMKIIITSCCRWSFHGSPCSWHPWRGGSGWDTCFWEQDLHWILFYVLKKHCFIPSQFRCLSHVEYLCVPDGVGPESLQCHGVTAEGVAGPTVAVLK